MLADSDTLMFDMDGTLLDLAFDNYVWLHVVPVEYARQHEIPEDQARSELYTTMRDLQGRLDWYCLDHWSERLNLDIAAIHRDLSDRIGYLPGAEEFLTLLSARGNRMLLVTNSHRTTLDIKNEVTGVTRFFDEIYTSHDLGHPKEEQAFWQELRVIEDFDTARTLFVDDNLSVLASARTFGIRNLVAVAYPDTSEPVRVVDGYVGVEKVASLLPASSTEAG